MQSLTRLLLLLSLAEAHKSDVAAVGIRDKDSRSKYITYLQKHHGGSIHWRNNVGLNTRHNIYNKRGVEIDRHNRNNMGSGYRKAENKFTDMTKMERQLNTGLANVTSSVHKRSLGRKSRLQLREVAPEAFDHRTEGHVSPVTNQGMCGSCWAFAAVYALEGALSMASEEKVKQLSVQEMLSCTFEDDEARNGCRGGWYMDGWEYVKEHGRLAEAASDPYRGLDTHCDPDISRKPNALTGYTVVDWERVPEGDDAALAQFSAKHVISVGVDSTNLFEYSEGVFRDEECAVPGDVDHAVTVVGYTTQVWIVKNSWGDEWGEEGYVMITRELKSHCGIADYAYFPIVEKSVKDVP